MAAIEKRGETSYRLTVSCGYDKLGKQIRKFKTIDLEHIPSKKRDTEAQKQWLLFKDEVEKGVYLDAGKITFEEFIEKWLKEYAEPNLAPKTLSRYKEILNTRVIPCLGHIKLNKLQPTHLMEFYNILREDGIRKDKKTGGLSERTILHHHRVISSILTAAVHWQFILSNPAERVRAPKVSRKEVKYFNEEEALYILQLLNSEHIKYKTMIYLALLGGMRLGELVGLEWSDINFDNKTLKIRQASQYLPKIGIFTKDTKNESSERMIALPDTIIKILHEYKLWQNGEKAKMDNLWEDNNRLFTQYNGKPIYPGTPSIWFHNFIKKHNQEIMDERNISDEVKPNYLLPNVNFHGLRHTNASLLIYNGIDIPTVSKRLGHARISTTADIYSHSLKKADIESAEKLENMIKKNNKLEKQENA